MTEKELAAIRQRFERAEYIHSGRWGESPIDAMYDMEVLLNGVDRLRAALNQIAELSMDATSREVAQAALDAAGE